MPYADWSKRYACQKRWKQENRGKVRAQKQRARIKKKCLSKSLVVVLEDCCKKDEQLRRKLHQRLYQRNRKRMTKTLTVVLEDYRLKKLPTSPPKNEKRNAHNERCRNYYQLNRERIRAQRKECRQRNLEKCRAQSRASSQRYRQKNEKRNAHNERCRNYYQLNRERFLAQRKEWRQKNLERCRAQSRASSQRYRQKNERCRNYYQLNRERIRAQRKEWRQKNLEKCRAQNRASSQRYRQSLQGHPKKHCVELQKEWRRKNRDVVNERRREQRRTNREALNEKRREHRRQHRDVINRAECEYRRKHRETSNQKKRVRYWMKQIAARAEEPTTSPCDCGLCLTCGGYETESWSHNFIVPRSDPLEVMERRLDQLETTWSDTSSEVDPALEKELERLLNETSSDEADSESEEEEDVVEPRLASLRRKREEDMTQRLVRWEREEAVTNLSAELGGVQGELRDMERWFEQFHREDEAQPDQYTQTLMVTSHLMNELERFLFSQ